jgi:hypothetical protein
MSTSTFPIFRLFKIGPLTEKKRKEKRISESESEVPQIDGALGATAANINKHIHREDECCSMISSNSASSSEEGEIITGNLGTRKLQTAYESRIECECKLQAIAAELKAIAAELAAAEGIHEQPRVSERVESSDSFLQRLKHSLPSKRTVLDSVRRYRASRELAASARSFRYKGLSWSTRAKLWLKDMVD